MKLNGVLAPVPTPFDEQDRVDTRRLTAALTKWMARPLHGVVVLGSNGFAGFWLPRDVDARLTVESDGRTGTATVSTTPDDPTCLTTLRLV